MTVISIQKEKLKETLNQLPIGGIGLLAKGGIGSHIGPVIVASEPRGDGTVYIAPLRDKEDSGRLVVKQTIIVMHLYFVMEI